MRSPFTFSLLLGVVAFFAEDKASSMATSAPSVAVEPRQYLLILRLAPRLRDDRAWTKADTDAVGAHFQRLKAATEAGQVLIAGRTDEPVGRAVESVVFTAPDEAAARAFTQADPCVAAGVMLPELHPYTVALRAH